MPLEAARWTHDGRDVLPSTQEEWNGWVSASKTRNYLLDDPQLDWLGQYGQVHGYTRDDRLPDYDPRLDFTAFIFRQGNAFEAGVLAHLRGRTDITEISRGPQDIRQYASVEATFRAMCQGAPVIYQGVLFDAESQTYGAPDLLVRSDVLGGLFPKVDIADAALPAPDLPGSRWHYKVVDIKFTTLHLNASNELANGGSAPAYKGQLFLYNQALGKLQGYTSPHSYLLGRGWVQDVKGGERGTSCMELLAPVPQSAEAKRSGPLAVRVAEAVKWVRRLRAEGDKWDILPTPTVAELWPNMTNQEDAPWHNARRKIAGDLKELTLLWQVGVAKRTATHLAGLTSWTDPTCTAEMLGVTGKSSGPVLQAILDINHAQTGPAVVPAKVHASEEVWRDPPLAFYVDFETVGDLADDFRHIPERGGDNLIFMIGCGHLEDGEWRFSCFTATALSEAAEATIIEQWLAHMEATRQRLTPDVPAPPVIHWSSAETSFYENSYNAATQRHPEQRWPSPNWFDFLGRVMRAEPVVVRGALGFGLKTVARAFRQHGLIQTNWGDSLADGLSAMVAAWWCQEEAERTDCSLIDLRLMQEVAEYNEIDCKVMMEIVQYLRRCH